MRRRSCDGLLGVARQRLAAFAPADQRADNAVGRRDAVEAAVEQRIGDAGLLA